MGKKPITKNKRVLAVEQSIKKSDRKSDKVHKSVHKSDRKSNKVGQDSTEKSRKVKNTKVAKPLVLVPYEDNMADIYPKVLLKKKFQKYHVFVFNGVTPQGTHSCKFWAIKRQGLALITVYGSVDKNSIRSNTSYPEASIIQQELLKKINQKQKKGYRFIINPQEPKQ